jgi:hypothetical protein
MHYDFVLSPVVSVSAAAAVAAATSTRRRVCNAGTAHASSERARTLAAGIATLTRMVEGLSPDVRAAALLGTAEALALDLEDEFSSWRARRTVAAGSQVCNAAPLCVYVFV